MSQKAVEREINKGVAHLTWAAVMVLLALAEWQSIQRLNGDPVPANTGSCGLQAVGTLSTTL